MRWGHLELFSVDTAKAKTFYVDGLGFELTDEQPGGIVWLKSGEVEILLRPGNPGFRAPSYQEASSAVVLYCENLQETQSRLAAKGIYPVGDDGEGCPAFVDPDGHWIQIVEFDA